MAYQNHKIFRSRSNKTKATVLFLAIKKESVVSRLRVVSNMETENNAYFPWKASVGEPQYQEKKVTANKQMATYRQSGS